MVAAAHPFAQLFPFQVTNGHALGHADHQQVAGLRQVEVFHQGVVALAQGQDRDVEALQPVVRHGETVVAAIHARRQGDGFLLAWRRRQHEDHHEQQGPQRREQGEKAFLHASVSCSQRRTTASMVWRAVSSGCQGL